MCACVCHAWGLRPGVRAGPWLPGQGSSSVPSVPLSRRRWGAGGAGGVGARLASPGSLRRAADGVGVGVGGQAGQRPGWSSGIWRVHESSSWAYPGDRELVINRTVFGVREEGSLTPQLACPLPSPLPTSQHPPPPPRSFFPFGSGVSSVSQRRLNNTNLQIPLGVPCLEQVRVSDPSGVSPPGGLGSSPEPDSTQGLI